MFVVDANILQPLIDVANAVLKFFHDSVGLSWGMSIIALTVCTRALLIPLTYKQIKGMRAMQALQPQIKELQEKYKNDKQRMQQEMMRFYKENKVNPFASCIPLIAQLPVFITLFYTLRHELPPDMGCEAGHCSAYGAEFLFVKDLTASAHGAELIALLVLWVRFKRGYAYFVTDRKIVALRFLRSPLHINPGDTVRTTLDPQAQRIAFYKATHAAQVTGPLVGSAENEATQTIRGSFIQPTLNALGYTLDQFTLRWAASPATAARGK